MQTNNTTVKTVMRPNTKNIRPVGPEKGNWFDTNNRNFTKKAKAKAYSSKKQP